MPNPTDPTVIVGGGFVGLFTALHLRHRHYERPVILIDPRSRFAFKPLLYEYLTGEMQEEQVVPAYAELLQGSDIVFVQDSVTQIDLQQRCISLGTGLHYAYQHLVLAVGSEQGYFGTQGAKEDAFPFRTQNDVLKLQRHLHDCLQRASQMTDLTQRQALLTVAVVGAGPSGVEMAATLADLFPDWYAKLGGDIQEIRVVLVNHGDQILAGDVNAHLQETALDAFKNRAVPVELMLGVSVVSVDSSGLDYKTKEQTRDRLSTATTIWTAGTATNPLIQSLSLSADTCDKHGRPFVLPTLQMFGFPEVFAAGDCAVVQSRPQPPVAQIAYQQGAGIASNLVALSKGQPPQPVAAHMRGTLMKLGIHSGVANLFDKVQVSGEVGDLIRNATYLEMLPTPIHNFKATTEWLTDEIFDRHRLPKRANEKHSREQNHVGVWIGGVAMAYGLPAVIATLLIAGLFWGLKTRQPSQPQPTEQPSSSE
ncbi:MAG: FAD-dependent oxidoreductase [Thermosynechococcaceae cyanobacterium]